MSQAMTDKQVTPWRSASCIGEVCSMCGAPAAAKVGEEIAHDDPHPYRHNLTAYVCAEHFGQIMGLIMYIVPDDTKTTPSVDVRKNIVCRAARTTTLVAKVRLLPALKNGVSATQVIRGWLP